MKTRKVLSLMIALVMLMSAFAGCSNGKKTEGQTQTKNETRIITDHNGNEVEVKNEIGRIVICDIFPIASVLTVFFDSAEKIVGMPPASMAAAKNGLLGELFPEILNASTAFSDGSTVNIEEVIKLSPDVAFYSASNESLGEELRAAGIPALAVSAEKWDYDAIKTLENWAKLFGEIFTESDRSEKVISKCEEIYKLVGERVKDIPQEEKEKVFFLFQYSDTTMLTSGKKFFGQWWADAIGAVNVGSALENNNSAPVNMEQVYQWNPSLIFITNFTTATPDTLYTNGMNNDDWSVVSAVKNKRVYKMPLGMYRGYLPGADTPLTLLWLAKTAYPKLFEDIDIIDETKAYYSEVFSITLTDTQAEKIFAPSSQAGNVSDVK